MNYIFQRKLLSNLRRTHRSEDAYLSAQETENGIRIEWVGTCGKNNRVSFNEELTKNADIVFRYPDPRNGLNYPFEKITKEEMTWRLNHMDIRYLIRVNDKGAYV